MTNQEIGIIIKDLRIRRGLSFRALGDLSGVQFANIGKLERGEYNPSVNILNKLLEALNCELIIKEKNNKSIMNMEETNKLQEIADFFCGLYKEEINNITGDAISEWWNINWSNWVNNKEDIEYNKIEKTIFEKIDDWNTRYKKSEDGLIKFDTYSDSWPANPEDCAYLVEDDSKLELDPDSSDDKFISYYQGEKGALVIEHDSDGTENPIKSGWYLTDSFAEYKEMYLD